MSRERSKQREFCLSASNWCVKVVTVSLFLSLGVLIPWFKGRSEEFLTERVGELLSLLLPGRSLQFIIHCHRLHREPSSLTVPVQRLGPGVGCVTDTRETFIVLFLLFKDDESQVSSLTWFFSGLVQSMIHGGFTSGSLDLYQRMV